MRDRTHLSDDFINGPDADLTPSELDHDVAAVVQTDRLAKLRGNTTATGFRDAIWPDSWLVFLG